MGDAARTVWSYEMLRAPAPAPTNELQLRKVGPSVERRELDAVSKVLGQLARAHDWADVVIGRSVKAWADHLRIPGVEVFALERGPSLVGAAELRTVGLDTEIVLFGLRPSRQGQGLGASALEAVLQAAWGAGQRLNGASRTRRVHLQTTSADHERARGLYERAGFAVAGSTTMRVAAASDPQARRGPQSRGRRARSGGMSLGG